MAVLSNTGILAGSSAAGEAEDPPYEVSHSYRINREDSSYLYKTFSGGDRNKGTISFWVRRGGSIGTQMAVITSFTSTGPNKYFDIGFAAGGDDDELEFRDYGTGNSTFYHTGHAYRDPAAWMHICVNWNSELEDSMEEDRLTVWINGEQKHRSTFRYHEKWDGKDEDCEMFRGSSTLSIGRWHSGTTRYADCHVAEVIGISGLQTTPDLFAEYNSDGVWVPREVIDSDNNNEIKLRTPNTDAGSPTWSTSHTSISGNRSGSGTGSYAWNMVFNGNWIADTSGYEQGCLPATNASPWVPQHVTWTGDDQIITWKNRMRMLVGFDDRGQDGIYVDVTTSSEGLQRFQGSGSGHINTSGNKYWAVVSEQPGTLEKVTHVMNAGGNTAVIWAIEVDGVVLKDDHTDPTHHDPHSDSWYLNFADASTPGKDLFNATNFTANNVTAAASDSNGGTLIKKTAGTYMGGHSGAGWNSTPPGQGTNNTLIGTGREDAMYEFSPTIAGNGNITVRAYTDGGGTGDAKLRAYDGSSWGSWVDVSGGSGYQWQNTSLGVNNIEKLELDHSGGGHDPHIAGFFLNGGTANSDWWQYTKFTTGNSDITVESPTNYGTDTGLGGEVRGTYAALNHMQHEKTQSGTFKKSNLHFTAPGGGSGYPTVAGTMGVSSGKWYWEVWLEHLPANNYHGISTPGLFNLDLTVANTYPGTTGFCYVIRTDNGSKYNNQAASSYGESYTGGDYLQVALDLDNGKIWFGKNGTWQNSGNPATGANEAYSGLNYGGEYLPVFSSYNQGQFLVNFGARPFKYQAPSGFKCICSTNLPTTVKEKEGFEARTIRGNMDARGWRFGPDFIWLKRRDTTNGFTLFDKIRGTTSRLDCQGNAAAETTSTAVTAFNDNGFTTGSNVNVAGDSVVAWCWEGGASITPSSSYDITPSDQYLNADAGFSMTKWTGTGTAGDKVPHALGKAPAFIISKSIDATGHWQVKHQNNANNAGLMMDQDDAEDASPTNGNLANLSSSVTFGFNNGSSSCNNVNESGTAYITYCWAEIQGFSKFGYYTGNGSASAGPFAYTGFRPGVLLIKSVDSRGWAIQDTARSPHNQVKFTLFPSADGSEYTSTNSTGHYVDLLSNGFRIRNDNTRFNTSGEKYLFMAWAEAPMKTARAR